jgi:hypothetical protein
LTETLREQARSDLCIAAGDACDLVRRAQALAVLLGYPELVINELIHLVERLGDYANLPTPDVVRERLAAPRQCPDVAGAILRLETLRNGVAGMRVERGEALQALGEVLTLLNGPGGGATNA